MIPKTAVKLPETLVNQLLLMVQQSPNNKIGGVVGVRGRRSFCYPIDVTSSDAHGPFSVNANDYLTAIKMMAKKGQTLFAIYHSHSTSVALPLAIELEGADYPDALYLIISLNTRGVLDLRGFSLRNKKIDEVELSI
tara:strand:- start:106130 stop:106540 length:411 start_codon:yes stop_codon:yes gene_type:complete